MNDSSTYCVIMAGGTGTRFWPLSTIEHPKQFTDVLGIGKTLIQQTYERLLQITSKDKIYIITDKLYTNLVKEQLPMVEEAQVIVEPVGMNTAPCVLYSSLRIDAIEADAKVVFCPADHLILEPAKFKKQINLAIESLDTLDGVYTLGIKPTRPDTGYGYIQFVEEEAHIKKVKTFTEKPNLELAEKFLESGDFLWNSGVFIWKVSTLLQAFKDLLPEMYNAFAEVQSQLGTPAELKYIASIYPTLQRVSIDVGVIEKYKNVYVIPSSFGWSDLGTWSSLYENFKKESSKNAIHGKMVKTYNAHGNMIHIGADKAVVIEGLEDFIVVDTQEALLICPLSSDQSVKKYVNDLKLTKGGDRFV